MKWLTCNNHFVHSQYPNHVCKLNKSLYGLKQVPRQWFTCLYASLIQLGFTGSKTYTSLFYYNKNGQTIFCLVYVDDIILTGNDSTHVQSLINFLKQQFALKDLGTLHYFLGIEVLWSSNGVLLTQQKYIQDLIQKAKMDMANGISTPSCP